MIILWILLSSAGVVTTAQDYLGCYKGFSAETDGLLAFNHTIAPTGCVTECKTRYYMYAGLMNGQQCYCFNRYEQDGQLSSGCKIPCATDSNFFCGSHDSISVYSTGQLRPSPPKMLRVMLKGKNAMLIVWEPPNSNVTNYVIRVNAVETFSPHPLRSIERQYYDDHDEEYSSNSSKHPAFLISLHPGTKYNISVSSLDTHGESDPISILSWTSLGPPNKPKRPKILEQTLSTLTVQLTEANSENGPVTSHQVLVVRSGTIPLIGPKKSFPNYHQAIKDNIPYYITGEFEASEFCKSKKFIIGDGKMVNGYYNAPLNQSFEKPQIGLIAVSRMEDDVQYSCSDLTENSVMKLPH